MLSIIKGIGGTIMGVATSAYQLVAGFGSTLLGWIGYGSPTAAMSEATIIEGVTVETTIAIVPVWYSFLSFLASLVTTMLACGFVFAVINMFSNVRKAEGVGNKLKAVLYFLIDWPLCSLDVGVIWLAFIYTAICFVGRGIKGVWNWMTSYFSNDAKGQENVNDIVKTVSPELAEALKNAKSKKEQADVLKKAQAELHNRVADVIKQAAAEAKAEEAKTEATAVAEAPAATN